MEMIKIETFIMHQNVYIYFDAASKEGIIVDAGGDATRIIDCIEENGIKVMAILLTHGHFDHIGAVDEVRKHTGAIVYSHELEKNLVADSNLNLSKSLKKRDITVDVDETFRDGDVYSLGDTLLKVIHTPGHTPGCVCYYDEKNSKLFTGDTLFKEGIGRSDFPGGNINKLISSVKGKIFNLPEGIEVFPGHGEATTIKYEKAFNPFVQ